MKKKEKRMILTILLVGILIIGGIYLLTRPEKEEENKVNTGVEQQNKVGEEFVQVMDDGSKLNTSTKLNQTKNVNGLEIGNIQLTMTGGETTLLADVRNKTGKDVGVTAIEIILYAKDGSELVTFGGVIGNVKSGESVKLQASTTLDFANAYDFKVVIK